MAEDEDGKVEVTRDLVETLSTLSTELVEVEKMLESTADSEAIRAPRQELLAVGEAIRAEVSNLAEMLGAQVLETLRESGVEVDSEGNVSDPAVLAVLEKLLASSGANLEGVELSVDDLGDGSAEAEIHFDDDES